MLEAILRIFKAVPKHNPRLLEAASDDDDDDASEGGAVRQACPAACVNIYDVFYMASFSVQSQLLEHPTVTSVSHNKGNKALWPAVGTHWAGAQREGTPLVGAGVPSPPRQRGRRQGHQPLAHR